VKKNREVQIGDFVEVNFDIYREVAGRIIAVNDEKCMVALELGGIIRVPKENVKVTLTVKEHMKSVSEWLAKEFEEDRLGK